MVIAWVILAAVAAVPVVHAVNPTNCSEYDVLGDWIFYMEQSTNDNNVNCDNKTVNHYRSIKISLMEEGLALQDDFIYGTWTMIFNEGLEITIGFVNYFAYFNFKYVGKYDILSYCDATMTGRALDVRHQQYFCFYGRQYKFRQAKKYDSPAANMRGDEKPDDAEYLNNMMNEIRRSNPNWEPFIYDDYTNLTYNDLRGLAGGESGYMPWIPPIKNNQTWDSGNSTFDWRNVSGVSYVSPPRHQYQCASCYAFVATGMMQDRVRVFTKNKVQPTFSTQDIINCDKLDDGCSGGFPYKAAGRYGWETGLVEESCVPYKAKQETCAKVTCPRWYTASYNYVGGYFGGCSEQAMIEALQRGPIATLINIHHDFYMYKSGIYHRPGGDYKIPPGEIVPINHALVIIGYGVDDTSGLKYWIGKNSWGPHWGENGFIRVLRGVNEIGIESVATEAFPIPRF